MTLPPPGEPLDGGQEDSSPRKDSGALEAEDAEILIIGAGISGLGAGIELSRRGRQSYVLLEAAEDLGGTWRDNRYPGVAVDIPSSSYCYSFETDYPWSRRFAPGHEILAYLRHCANKYGVTPHIRYGCRVERCELDEDRVQWRVHVAGRGVLRCRYLISATGLFGAPKVPRLPGLERFAGKTMHSGRWDATQDLSGKRVAVVGTGATAVQLIPELARRVAHLTVFQRTPIWVSPRLDAHRSRGLSLRRFPAIRWGQRWLSELGLELLTFSIVNFRRLPLIVVGVQGIVRALMAAQLPTPSLRQALLPRYRLGCKRPATSNEYLATFLRENVTLTTCPLEHVCEEGLVTEDGQLWPVEVIVWATGFETTERTNLPRCEVFGRGRVDLGGLWDTHGLSAYAGVAIPGFPNFFLTAGPYAGGLNWFSMLETNLTQILRCLETCWVRQMTQVEVERHEFERYMSHMRERAAGTVFESSDCASSNSYYVDRHGSASLPSPHTPGWRARYDRRRGVAPYRFSRG